MSIGFQVLTYCVPKTSGEEPIVQLLFIIIFDATAANPIFLIDPFVRFVANVENTTAAIADRVIAIVRIKVSHAVTAICVSLNSMVMSLPRSTLRTMLGVRRTNSAKSSPLTAWVLSHKVSRFAFVGLYPRA